MKHPDHARLAETCRDNARHQREYTADAGTASTFAECHGCRCMTRGGGICPECWEYLARLVDKETPDEQ